MANLSVLLVLAIFATCGQCQTPKKGARDWQYVADGGSLSFSGSISALVDVDLYFYTEETSTLTLNCKINLPCATDFSIQVISSDDSILGWYCTGTITRPVSTPKMASLWYMSVFFIAGYTGSGTYSCVMTSTAATTVVPTTAITATVPSSSCQCGTTGGPKIIGGAPVTKGAIPWQVALGSLAASSFYAFCGGTLIGANYVITAAHCIKNSELYVKIFMGDVDLRSQTALIVGLAKIQQHEQYNTPVSSNNDIALLTLDRSVTYTSDVFPACLPRGAFSTETFVGKSLLVSGWGTMTSGANNYPDIMQSVQVKGITNTECSSAYSDITDGMLCAAEAGKDSCQGDSGGPLTYTQAAITYLVGVVSFGTGCALPDYPGVYTRVTKYLDWIDSKTGSPLCSK